MTQVCRGILSQGENIVIASFYLSLRAFICHCEARSNLAFLFATPRQPTSPRSAVLSKPPWGFQVFFVIASLRSNLTFGVGERWKERSPRFARDDTILQSLRAWFVIARHEAISLLSVCPPWTTEIATCLAMTREWFAETGGKGEIASYLAMT